MAAGRETALDLMRRPSILTVFKGWRKGFDRAVRAVAKTASRTARKGRIVVQTYRGYGSERRLFLMGRVFREPVSDAPTGQGVWSNLRTIWRLMRRWGLPEAKLCASFGDSEQVVYTDQDGYFRLDLEREAPPSPLPYWHRIKIDLSEPVAISAEGDVFVPGSSCRFVVISDIDDTVMHTGVANKLKMMWRLFVQGAEGRTAFPGMAAFLRALHRGQALEDGNPMLYVSRAPWAIYGVLDRFFNLHDIPNGPILFLRDWGLTLQHPLPKRGRGHKLHLIRQMIDHYGDLPFVLIGDSGQRDPEIYAEIVHSYPNRVLAVYIRDVSADPKRDLVIERMAAELAEKGSALVLAEDTIAMANHAAETGLIADSMLADIGAEVRAGP